MGMVDRIRKRVKRRQDRRAAKNPRQQYYGGSQATADMYQQRNLAELNKAESRQDEGLAQIGAERQRADDMYAALDTNAYYERHNAGDRLREIGDEVSSERAAAGEELGALSDQALRERAYAGAQLRTLDRGVASERAAAGQRYGQLLTQVQGQQRRNAMDASRYGQGADTALTDYRSGRAATLSNAAEIERLGREAPGAFQSAADAAFNASSERNQRNALSLAAGRGNDAIRTAIAAADTGNRQAQLDQQVVRAQEMNQLLELQQGAQERAANIRGNVGAADQNAASIQSNRQQGATNASNTLLDQQGRVVSADAETGLEASRQRAGLAATNAEIGLSTNAQRGSLATTNAEIGLNATGQRGALAQADADLGLATTTQRAGIAGANTAAGMAAAEARLASGAGAADRYLNAQQVQDTAQLGTNQAYEQARLARAQTRGFTGFLGKLTGGLNNIKAFADSTEMGPAGKLMPTKQPVGPTY